MAFKTNFHSFVTLQRCMNFCLLEKIIRHVDIVGIQYYKQNYNAYSEIATLSIDRIETYGSCLGLLGHAVHCVHKAPIYVQCTMYIDKYHVNYLPNYQYQYTLRCSCVSGEHVSSKNNQLSSEYLKKHRRILKVVFS